MSVLGELSSAIGARDESANILLAEKIGASQNKVAVKELIDALQNSKKAVRHDCIKVLYELAQTSPGLISPYTDIFIALLADADNRIQWGAMSALSAITTEAKGTIIKALPQIIRAADEGSVITRDHAVKILITLGEDEKLAPDMFSLLMEQLLQAPANQVPSYAEQILPLVHAANKVVFTTILKQRLDDFEKESKRNRVLKVIAKANKH